VSIIRPAGPALRRRPRLTSNVRPRTSPPLRSMRRRRARDDAAALQVCCRGTELAFMFVEGWPEGRPVHRPRARQWHTSQNTGRDLRRRRRRLGQGLAPHSTRSRSPANSGAACASEREPDAGALRGLGTFRRGAKAPQDFEESQPDCGFCACGVPSRFLVRRAVAGEKSSTCLASLFAPRGEA
jgi:hypothetical protein